MLVTYIKANNNFMYNSESEYSDSVSETTRLMDGHVATSSSSTAPLDVRHEVPKKRYRRTEPENEGAPSNAGQVKARLSYVVVYLSIFINISDSNQLNF